MHILVLFIQWQESAKTCIDIVIDCSNIGRYMTVDPTGTHRNKLNMVASDRMLSQLGRHVLNGFAYVAEYELWRAKSRKTLEQANSGEATAEPIVYGEDCTSLPVISTLCVIFNRARRYRIKQDPIRGTIFKGKCRLRGTPLGKQILIFHRDPSW